MARGEIIAADKLIDAESGEWPTGVDLFGRAGIQIVRERWGRWHCCSLIALITSDWSAPHIASLTYIHRPLSLNRLWIMNQRWPDLLLPRVRGPAWCGVEFQNAGLSHVYQCFCRHWTLQRASDFFLIWRDIHISDTWWRHQWKHFSRYWPFVRGIHRWPVDSPHKGQWRRDLVFSLICTWTNGWANNRNASDMRRHHAHHDVKVMGKCRAAE